MNIENGWLDIIHGGRPVYNGIANEKTLPKIAKFLKKDAKRCFNKGGYGRAKEVTLANASILQSRAEFTFTVYGRSIEAYNINKGFDQTYTYTAVGMNEQLVILVDLLKK